MDIKKIDSITFGVKDLAKSAKFYTDVLGLPEIWRMDEAKGVGFGVGDNSATLNLFQEAPAPGAEVIIQVEDVATARGELEKKGVRFQGQIETLENIGKAAHFTDPDGSRLMLDHSIEHAREAGGR